MSTGPKGGHGRRSALIQAFGERIRALMEDPEIFRFEPDLAVFDQALDETLAGLPDQDSPGWRQELLEQARVLDAVMKTGSVKAFASGWERLLATIRAGARRATMLGELQANRERRSHLAAQALSAKAKADHAVTVKDMVVLMGRMVDVVVAEFGEDAGRRICQRFERDVVRIGGEKFTNGAGGNGH